MAEGLTCRLVELRTASIGGVGMLVELGAPVIVEELGSPRSERAFGVDIAPADCRIGSLVGVVNVGLTCPVGIEGDDLGAERMWSGIFPCLRRIPLPINGLRFGS